MSSAAQEPRRWTLQTTFGSDGWATRAFNGHEIGRSESIPVIEAAAYDALLAERDALKMDRDYWQGATRVLRSELAALKIENDEADALNTMLSRILTDTAHVLKGTPEALHSHSWADLAQVAAAIKEKAERLHTDFRNATIMNLDVGQECEKCEKWWKYDSPIVERHAPDCPAHPDFLTTSATESREAKGGTT